jgi:hypothetical protein
MILCQRPFTIYHVDVLGALGLLAIALAGWWLAIVPWRQTCSNYRELGRRRAGLEAELQTQAQSLERTQRDLTWLEGVIAAQAVEVPRPDSVPNVLREMTELAQDSKIDLLSLMPQPAAPEGVYVVSDIQATGRGHSRSFIRFLDRLAQRNPFQALTHCSLRRGAGAADESCELSWTLRLYMLPAADAGPGGIQ